MTPLQIWLMWWIVSGFMRSGTSAMMRALAAGGMELYQSMSASELAKKNADPSYVLNPNYEVFEPRSKEAVHPMFLARHPGKVIKILATVSPRVRWLQSMNMAVIFMMRDPVEVAASYTALRNKNEQPLKPDEIALYQRTEFEEFRHRADGRVIAVDYNDMIDDPLRIFERIKRVGWPIDVEKAASVIDRREKRHVAYG